MSWVYRLAAALLLIVAAANAWSERPSLHPRSEIAQRLASMFPASDAAQVRDASERIYQVSLRACPRPLIIAVVPPSFTPRAALLNLAAPGDRTLYAYTDWVGAEPDRIAVFARRVWRPLLTSVGLSRYGRLREMLVIAEPAGCDLASTARWERYWRGGGKT
ncbi:hypothetical protein [Phenylobacterium deserti]|uniref:Uncharacterized protein n=1 Tax=Phenylobacterium deserti TaxID=1914756 RepID=A0A328ABZ5_9CAUL|nr:hypothetical protein [Phenylobacterium deserti]RAK50874.1 hypothetical protein DJ018_17020 [Phenylobacterium deserti]